MIQVFLIRHKETKEFMPLTRRNKGYSWWNPGTKTSPSNVLPNTVRILPTERQAKQVITQWTIMPNSSIRGYTDHSTGEDDYDICTSDDGRKKEDLEIVPARIVFDET